MTGQHLAEQIHRPALERLRHQGVVGVGERLRADIPGLFPVQSFLVKQQPHQFGNGDGRVGVVELDGDFVVECVEGLILFFVAPHDVLEGGADEKVLLFQAQLLAGIIVVGRIEYLGNGLGADLVLHRADIVALAEMGQVEFPRGPGRPKSHIDHMVVLIARHQDIARHGHNILGFDPFGAIAALLVLEAGDLAVKFDAEHRQATFKLPGGPIAQPVVRALHLIAVDQLLVEQPVLITDTVPVGRNLQGGDGIHEAGGQPSETAIAESGIFLLFPDLLERIAKPLDRLLHFLPQTKIDDGIAERPANQKLERQVIDPFLFLGVIGLLGFNPFFHHDIAHRKGQRLVDIGRAGAFRIPPLKADQVVDDVVLDRFDGGREILFPGTLLTGFTQYIWGRCAHLRFSQWLGRLRRR